MRRRVSENGIQIGDSVSTQQVLSLYDRLQACTLPKRDWTHGAHLCAGCAIVTDLGLSTAEARMPSLIRAYNTHCGVINSETSGYHHTLTLLYLKEIDRFLNRGASKTLDLGGAASAVLASPLAVRHYPLTLYSKSVLFSKGARQSWVEPDLARFN